MTESQAQPPAALELKPIYVASRASVPERGIMWRWFRSQGYLITSSWIDEDGEGATADFGELWLRIADEIRKSAALVLYAEAADFPLKGALTEAGIALGMGKPVFVCLPDLGVLPRNYRPIGSWIAHPLVTRCDNVAAAVKLASRADLPRAAADDVVTGYINECERNPRDVKSASWAYKHEAAKEIAERLRAASPRAQTGLTVEAALAQLKELTAHRCEISFFTSGQVAITVFANSIIPMGLFRTLRSTLDEAFNDVRAWAKSHAGREGERT